MFYPENHNSIPYTFYGFIVYITSSVTDTNFMYTRGSWKKKSMLKNIKITVNYFLMYYACISDILKWSKTVQTSNNNYIE